MKNDKLIKLLREFQNKEAGFWQTYQRISSLMGEKELGVLSTSTTKDGDLHSVRDSHASGSKSGEEVRSNGSLEKITSNGNTCNYCNGQGYLGHEMTVDSVCYLCMGTGVEVE